MATYEEQIRAGLDGAYTRCRSTLELNPADARVVMFSDHHRGQMDGADDFQKCKAIYHAALAYYEVLGYMVILLGDVEELWENRPSQVMKHYADTLAIEARFAKAGRLIRIYGNHSSYWANANIFEKHLKSHLGGMNAVAESVILKYPNTPYANHELFLTHGHQGTPDSDKYARRSRFLVRYLWANFQRLVHIRSTLPSKDFVRRSKHEMAMFSWALQRNAGASGAKVVLIAGHTHHPVFESAAYDQRLEKEIQGLKDLLTNPHELARLGKTTADVTKELAEKSARLAKERAQSNGVESNLIMDNKPCYFNSGCCSYADGDITALAIEGTTIRLVRWPEDDGSPREKLLQEKDLFKDVFPNL